MRKIELMVPDMPEPEAIMPYLRRIKASKRYSNDGPIVRELEERIGFLSSQNSLAKVHAVAVCNGTIGLTLALLEKDLTDLKCIMSPVTFKATYLSVAGAKGESDFRDPDPVNLQLTPDDYLMRCANRGYVLMPVATFGVPIPSKPWESLAEKMLDDHIIFDSAGALVNQVVPDGVTVVCSMHATKLIGAGEGGVILTRNIKTADRLRGLRNFDDYLGINGKMSEYSAAVGCASMDMIHDKLKWTSDMYTVYKAMLNPFGVEIVSGENSTMLCVKLPGEGDVALDAGYHLNILGIESKQWYRPFLDEFTYTDPERKPGEFPVTDNVRRTVLGIPFHKGLSLSDIDYVCATIGEFIGERKSK